eukprot:TRINITY_DN21287_c0_g1_i2.p1 TRINITY_DN21287_c0_g1~~TRINITY_DN21287_c0_g1_i2.p1  ORF type:complete len:1183 (+),score=287.60 TRINITY_DN21287_c0_g1_i2:29-3577(+)
MSSLVRQLQEVSSVLVSNVMKLSADLTDEDVLVEGAKSTATATYDLIKIIHDHDTTNEEIKEILLNYAKGLREKVVEYIRQVRQLYTNNIDYWIQQAVRNSREELIGELKRVMKTAKALERLEEGKGGMKERLNLSDAAIKKVKEHVHVSFQSLELMDESITSKDTQKFKQSATDLVVSLKSLTQAFEDQKKFSVALQELHKICYKTVSLSRVALESNEQSYLFQALQSSTSLKESLRDLVISVSAQSNRFSRSLNEEADLIKKLKHFSYFEQEDDDLQMEIDSVVILQPESTVVLPLPQQKSIPDMPSEVNRRSRADSLETQSKGQVKHNITLGRSRLEAKSKTENPYPPYEENVQRTSGVKSEEELARKEITPPSITFNNEEHNSGETAEDQSSTRSKESALQRTRSLSQPSLTPRGTQINTTPTPKKPETPITPPNDSKATKKIRKKSAPKVNKKNHKPKTVKDPEQERRVMLMQATTERILNVFWTSFPSVKTEWEQSTPEAKQILKSNLLAELNNLEMDLTSQVNIKKLEFIKNNPKSLQNATKKEVSFSLLDQKFELRKLPTPKINLNGPPSGNTPTKSLTSKPERNDMLQLEKIMAISSPRDLTDLTIKVKPQKGIKRKANFYPKRAQNVPGTFKVLQFSDTFKSYITDTHTFITTFGDLMNDASKEKLKMAEEIKTKYLKNIELINESLVAIMEIINRSLSETTPEPPLAKIMSRTYELLESFAVNETTRLDLNLESLKIGRLTQVLKINLLNSVNYKNDSFFFTSCQLLTFMSDFNNTNDFKQFYFDSLLRIYNILALLSSVIKLVQDITVDIETLYFLQLYSANDDTEESLLDSSPQTLKVHETAIYTWDEKIIESKKNEDKYSASTLDTLIFRLLPSYGVNDDRVLYTFLYITCSRKNTANKMIDLLFTIFNVPESSKFYESKNVIQQQVLSILLKLLRCNHFLQDSLKDQTIRNYLGSISSVIKEEKILAEQVQLIEMELERQERYNVPVRNWGTWPPSKIPIFGELDPSEIILLYEPELIAHQLSLIEFEIYVKIRPMELINQAWNSKKLQTQARNVVDLIKRVNAVSFWVSTSIVLQNKVNKRARLLSTFINIAKQLQTLRNYNTLMGIVAGLNTSTISRLKNTWALLRTKDLETYNELNTLMNPAKSFVKLRSTMSECSSLSVLPYM